MAGTRGAGWDPLFSRYFAFSTLSSLGYRTRVSLSNASDGTGTGEPVRLRISVHGPDGRRLLAARECGVLEPGRAIGARRPAFCVWPAFRVGLCGKTPGYAPRVAAARLV